MSVLVEAISVLVTRPTIENKYPGGLQKYIEDCPNSTFCMDDHLTRVGFMTPADVSQFVGRLQIKGLGFITEGQFVEIAVVDQHRGFTANCDWLDFSKNEDGISFCTLKGEPVASIATPKDWNLHRAQTLSFVDGSSGEARFKFLRNHDGVEVIWDRIRNKKVFVGRTNDKPSTKSAKNALPTKPIVKKSDEWEIGDRLAGRWEIHNIVKTGGMGIVFIVYDEQSNEPLAVKTFKDEAFIRNSELETRFRREATVWMELGSHPNITEAKMVESINGKPHLFLEYVGGGDLGQLIGSPKLTSDLPRVLRFGIQFCDGMSYAASKGLAVHRDIKPANCLVSHDDTLRITDFGLAKILSVEDSEFETIDSRMTLARILNRNNPEFLIAPSGLPLSHDDVDLTRTGSGGGTATHMAPEQFENLKDVSVRADVYSFGVTLFQMITGRLPFTGRSSEEYLISRLTQETPNPMSGIEVLDSLVMHCLEIEPNDRPRDFVEIREKLVNAYELVTGSPAPEPPNPSLEKLERVADKGVSLARLGLFDEAIQCWEKVLADDPNCAPACSAIASAYASKGEFPLALKFHDRAIEIAPNNWDVWQAKGRTFNAMSALDRAIECYDRSLSFDDTDASCWYDRGVSLNAKGDMHAAMESWNTAIRLEPYHEQAWANLGAAYMELRRHSESLECLERALKLNPIDEMALFNLGVLFAYRLKEYSKGLECFKKSLDLGFRNADAGIRYCHSKLDFDTSE